MSSILDALEKLESAPPPATPGGPPPRPTRRRFVVVGGVLVAFLAGLGIAAWLLRAPTVPPPALVASAPEPTPPPTVPSATAPPARPAARERPWVEVVEDARDDPESPAPETPSGTTTPRTPTPSPRAARPAPMAVPIAKAPPPATVSPSATPAPPRAQPRARTPPPQGAPDVRISFLVYSGTPARRSVALTIDGAGLVTLREGQGAQGLEVVQILPDGAHVTWEGKHFTVPARN